MVQTGLVAGDAGIDLVLAPLQRLLHQIGISQHRPRHADQISVPTLQHLFSHIGHVDAVGSDHRHADVLAQAPRHAGKGRARHHGGDGRHLSFMPAEVGGDDRGARPLHALGEVNHLFPGEAALKHVHGRDAEHDDEVGTDGGADASHHLQREALAVFPAPAPLVSALIGALDQKCGEEIPGRSDDLDAVIARKFGHGRAGGEVGQLFFNALFIKGCRRVGRDPRLDRRGSDAAFRPGHGSRMQDLKADFHVWIFGVNGFGDQTVLGGLLRRRQLHPAAAGLQIGRDAAGDDHADPALGPLGIIGGQAFETVLGLFQSGMHRAHQHPVLQPREAQIQRREQAGIFGWRGHGCIQPQRLR